MILDIPTEKTGPQKENKYCECIYFPLIYRSISAESQFCASKLFWYMCYTSISVHCLSLHIRNSSVRLYCMSSQPHIMWQQPGELRQIRQFSRQMKGVNFNLILFFSLHILGRKWHAVFLKTRKWSKLCPGAKSFESHALWTGCFWRPIYLKAARVTFERCVRRRNLHFRASRSYTLVAFQTQATLDEANLVFFSIKMQILLNFSRLLLPGKQIFVQWILY